MGRSRVRGTLAAAAICLASTTVPSGTEVDLKFDQAVSSKHAKVGDHINLHVASNVVVHGHTVIPAGTRVTGVIATVNKRGRFGKNAKIRIAINPVSVHGAKIALEPRDKGKEFKGSKTDKAAIASGAGLVLLGPIGLAGGYFIAGKPVNIKRGDPLRTEVTRNVVVP